MFLSSRSWVLLIFINIITITSNFYRIHGELPGKWELLVAHAGIASMHTAVTRYGTVVLLDRTNIGPSRRMLRKGHCRDNPYDRVLKHDCYAHSVLFDPSTNEIRPLMIQTDTWCSSGQFLPDGTLLQTGGDRDGFKKIRKFIPCERNESCDWEELQDSKLISGRWYSTNQILPDGSVIIVGGLHANNIEFYPPREPGILSLQFLTDVQDGQWDNLYPYVHLLPNGNLFIFANNRAIQYNYTNNSVVRDYPSLEGNPRNYPSAGSSVMLALQGNYTSAVIVVCGGAEYGAFKRKRNDTAANGSCGRIVATDPNPVWEMEDMPFGRTMGDMVMLPTGDVLIINGAQSGSQGFDQGTNPCLNPVLYRPSEPVGLRFMTLNPATVPRMYHSTANLLPDGRILVAGSNPHYYYEYGGDFPTELRLEAFSPEYLSDDRANLRPVIEELPEKLRYGQAFEILISVTLPVVGIVEVNIGNAPFATHSYSQGQRLVKLGVTSAVPESGGAVGGRYRIRCTAPPNSKVAPPGYYMFFAVNQGVPSVARWVQLIY
ncbi:hypothetical protein MKW98_000165 [Papaver atlanticum]|uniref:Aldehyde oxidase GLOX n=1 Tax=Papaver atlanticum TaxID=357466 RepID=A0AAD4SRG0_9MAGN|nr:hypothetical protein MKW98_000165 [Papaver atlanticum]